MRRLTHERDYAHTALDEKRQALAVSAAPGAMTSGERPEQWLADR
jgi:hypothetical protein